LLVLLGYGTQVGEEEKRFGSRDSVTKKKGYQRGTNAGGDYDRGEYKTGDKLEKKTRKIREN